jgi:hypothetical protein
MPRMKPEDLVAQEPAASSEPMYEETVITKRRGDAPMSQPAVEQPNLVPIAPAALPQESMKDFSQNPYKKWIYLAQAVDSWRIWPRAFMTVYIVLVYQVINWFMTIPEPNMNQAGLISVVVGAGAAWFGLYLGSSPRSSK